MTGSTSTESPALPAAVQLLTTVDADRLSAELSACTGHSWNRQRTFEFHGPGRETELDWRVLALRSPGGDPDRTDPGGPGSLPFATTKWLERMPYLESVLRGLGCEFNGIRLMALGPGTRSADHRDPKYGLRRGMVRLHIPLVTLPEAILVLDGVEHCWQPGTLWYGDFSREHRVQNTGTGVRVHVVIDTLTNRDLIRLFPPHWQPLLEAGGLLDNRPPVPAERTRQEVPECLLAVPGGLLDFSRYGDDVDLTGTDGLCPGRIRLEGGGPQLVLDDGRTYALVHLGGGELRFSGWSEERTIRLQPGPDEPRAVLYVRCGADTRRRSVPIELSRSDR